jgi:hypothetical protein
MEVGEAESRSVEAECDLASALVAGHGRPSLGRETSSRPSD